MLSDGIYLQRLYAAIAMRPMLAAIGREEDAAIRARPHRAGLGRVKHHRVEIRVRRGVLFHLFPVSAAVLRTPQLSSTCEEKLRVVGRHADREAVILLGLIFEV